MVTEEVVMMVVVVVVDPAERGLAAVHVEAAGPL